MEQARRGELPGGKLISLLDKLLAEDNLRKTALDSKREEVDKELEGLIAQIKQGELQRENQKGLDAARESLNQLAPQMIAATKALEDALSHQNEIPQLGVQVAQLEGKLSQYTASEEAFVIISHAHSLLKRL